MTIDIGPISVLPGTWPWALLVVAMMVGYWVIHSRVREWFGNLVDPPKQTTQHTRITIRQDKAINVFPSAPNQPFTIPGTQPAPATRPQLEGRRHLLNSLRGNSLLYSQEDVVALPPPRKFKRSREMVAGRDYTVY
jgi:hypothetical protein